MEPAPDPAALTAAALNVPGLGAGRLRALVDAYGSLAAAVDGAAGGGPSPAGFPRALFERLPASLDVAAAGRRLAQIRRAGVAVLCWEDARYPAPLWLDRQAPPPLLYLQGALPQGFRQPARRVRAAAVIGTRRATARGLALARELGRSLAELRVIVVSGLALGIDGAAHEGAVEGAFATVAVLGGGHGHLHPPSHRSLARRILDTGGAVLSEHPPDVRPEPHLFPVRNRIISGLSRLVVVVEAGVRSGTHVTAAYALDQQRDVFACPGRPGDPSVAGTLRLIRDGALVLTEMEDVLCRFRAEPGDPRHAASLRAGPGDGDGAQAPAGGPPHAPFGQPAPADPSPDEAVLRVLYGLDEATLDDIVTALARGAAARAATAAARPAPRGTAGDDPAHAGRGAGPATGVDVASLTARLTRLELRGAVMRTAAGRYRLAARDRERRAARESARGGS